jgi:pimeloyl-ACP methyl ester carboxylesterase
MVAAGLASAYHDPKIVTPEMVEVYYRPFLIDGAVEAMLAMSRGSLQAGTRTPPLSTLAPPAMIVWGRHDRIIPVAAAERFAQQLPRARKVIFEASGHLPHEEEPDRFNALAAEFAANPRWVEPTKDDRYP